MFVIKAVKGDVELVHQTESYSVFPFGPHGKQLWFKAVEDEANSSLLVGRGEDEKPLDWEDVFIMNEHGKTIDRY